MLNQINQDCWSTPFVVGSAFNEVTKSVFNGRTTIGPQPNRQVFTPLFYNFLTLENGLKWIKENRKSIDYTLGKTLKKRVFLVVLEKKIL